MAAPRRRRALAVTENTRYARDLRSKPVKIYDPIPWYIKKRDAKKLGLAKGGWYLVSDDRTPVVGPCRSPEECMLTVARLIESKRLRLVLTPTDEVIQIPAAKRGQQSHFERSR